MMANNMVSLGLWENVTFIKLILTIDVIGSLSHMKILTYIVTEIKTLTDIKQNTNLEFVYIQNTFNLPNKMVQWYKL